jgi:aryl-alcohol dehydrogenase-like predicted oxidoreductase
VLGRAFADRRDQVILATKIGPKADPNGPVEQSYPPQWIVECTENSLRRLGADYLDLQQIHCWRDHYTDTSDWFEALMKLRQQGKIRHFGVSAGDWDPTGAVRLVEAERTASVQVIYNIFEQRPAETLFPAAIEHGAGIIVRVPLEEGLLSGAIGPDYEFAEGDWRKDWLTPDRLAEAAPRLEALQAFLSDDCPTLAALALKFCLSHPAVSTVIVGMRNKKHVRANCALANGKPLPADVLEELKRHAFTHGWVYPWHKK